MLPFLAENALDRPAARSDPDDDDPWFPPDPVSTVLPFPLDCLPEKLAVMAQEAARSLQCPVDFLGVSMLAVAGAAIGDSRVLRVRAGYEEGSRIYAAIVDQPGQAKSPALRISCAPVYAEQNRHRDDYDKAKADYEKALAAYQAAQSSASTPDETTAPAPTKPEKPQMSHVYVKDVTTEALAPLLDRNPRGLLMIQDELTSWVLSQNQYRGGRGADRQFYLSCWSGEPAKVDRKSDQGESLIVANPFLCVVGCIPPAKLAELDATNEGEDGFIHRILFSFPTPVVGKCWGWDGLPDDLLAHWLNAVRALYLLTPGQDANGQPTAVRLDFADDARPLWEHWYNAHFRESESPDFPEWLVGPWSKLVAYAARLALIVHYLRFVCEETKSEVVEAESLSRSFRLIDYFKSHARAAYARLHSTDGNKKVRNAVRWIREHDGKCTSTQLVKNGVGGVAKASEAADLLKELEDRGYGKRDPVLRTRNHRAVVSFVLNESISRERSSKEDK